MKARIILIAAIIGILMITACGPAASESERTLEDGDADEDDIANMDKTIKAFESALKDKASEMEGCWIEVDEVKREQEQESE